MACETDGVDGFEVGAVDVATLAAVVVGAIDATDEVVTCGDGIDADSSAWVWLQDESCGGGSVCCAEKVVVAFHASGGAVGGGTVSAVIHPSFVDIWASGTCGGRLGGSSSQFGG